MDTSDKVFSRKEKNLRKFLLCLTFLASVMVFPYGPSHAALSSGTDSSLNNPGSPVITPERPNPQTPSSSGCLGFRAAEQNQEAAGRIATALQGQAMNDFLQSMLINIGQPPFDPSKLSSVTLSMNSVDTILNFFDKKNCDIGVYVQIDTVTIIDWLASIPAEDLK